MATEADTPHPVPLTERDGINVHLTAQEFNQPPEPIDYLLKSVHIQESSNRGDGAAHIDTEDVLGVSKGESFLESPLETKVDRKETCRKREPCEAVEMPHEAEKHLQENEKQVQIDEHFDAAQETLSKENDAMAEMKDGVQNVEENSEFVDSTEMVKIEEPEVKVQKPISLEEKMIQPVEEMVSVNKKIEENTDDFENEEEKTKKGDCAEVETSKEVGEPEGSLDQNTQVSAQTPNLTLDSANGGVQIIKEACLKDETANCAVGTEVTRIEENVRAQSSAGAEEKQPESCSSLLNEQCSETIRLIIEINTEKESSNDSVVAESLGTHNDQIAICESKEVAEDALDMPSVTPAADSPSIEETDLTVHEIAKTSGVACTTESQEPNMKDTSQVVEMQENKDADIPVIEMEAPSMQKVDNSVSEDIEREIPEIGISEMVEKQGETGKSETDNVKDEINPEQEASGMFMKQEEGEKSIEVEVSAKEISGEEKDSGEDAAKEPEINLSDAITTSAGEENDVEIKEHEKNLHGSSTQKDELENEKIEKSTNVVTEGADTTCSGENVVAITCTEEEALIDKKEESSKEKHSKEKSKDTDVNGDDEVSDKRDVPPTELTKKIESAGLEISKEDANELQRPQQWEHETTLVEDERLETVSDIQSQENVPGIQSQEDHCESSETCDGTKDMILDHSSEERGITTELIPNDAADNEKLGKVQELDTDEKEINSNRTNTEEQVEKKEEAHEIQISKSETNDENGKCKTGEVISDEVISTAFVEESTEQSSQTADPQENATALRDEVKENKNVDNAENEEVEDGPKISGIGEVTAEQSVQGGTQILAEPINQGTVKISQDIIEVAEMSGKEDIDKPITEEDVKDLSQESVEQCLDKNFQNEQTSNDMSSGEVHEEAETAKTVDNISSDANQNDEIPAPTLQTYLGKEEGSLQIKDVTPADPTAAEAKGKDEALMIKDREPENNEVLAEVTDKKETESSKHEEVENTLQKNESVEDLEESTGLTSTETEKDDSSKTAGTDRHESVESPQHKVNEEITENDEKIAEKSNSEILAPSESDKNSNSALEDCLLKEQEILKNEKLIPTEASATTDEDGSSKTNDAIQIEVKKKNEESMEHEENLEQTQKNKQVENLKAPYIVESSETEKDVSNEIMSNLEVETVEKERSDIKDDNTDFETVEEDRLDRKGGNAEVEVVEKDENDLRNDKAEAKTVDKEGLDKQADNAEVETYEKYGVDKKEDIAAAEMVEESNLDKQDDEVEKIEKDATEVETVKKNNLDKNADVEIVEKDGFDNKNDESKVEPVEGGDDKYPDNAELETIKEDGVDKKTDEAEIETVDSTRNEPKTEIGTQEDPKDQIIDDGTDSAPLECAEPSPVQDYQTDAKNAEDSNDKVVEPSKSAEKDENIADDANQKDEIPSTCISTSLVKEAERSHKECKNDPPSQTSPDEKEEEDVLRIKMDEDNKSTAALSETNASVVEEASKEANDIANEKNQNGESTNSNLQTSMAEEQGILESNNQAEAEASPAESKDEDRSYVKADEDNENDAVVPEVEKEGQEEKLKDEDSIPTISEESKADASSKITGDVEVEKVETPENNEKDSEIAEEENTGEPDTPKNNIKFLSEASDQQDPVNCQNDEEYSENSSREILGEFETATIGENVAHEKDQKDKSPCATLPGSLVEKEESPKHEDADATSADVSIDENREKDETPTKSGENNDSNADDIEGKEETPKSEEILEQEPEKKQMEVAEVTSKNEEKLEEERQKNEPEELLEQSSNFVAVETDAGTLSEGATATSLGEVGAIQNVEGTIEEGRQEEEETGNINAVNVEKAAMEEVSVGTISGTNEGIEKHGAMKEEETEINILPQPTERETSSTEAQDAVDTKKQDPAEENIVNDQSDIHAGEKINEDEMINSASKQEINEIIQAAEKDDNTGKQMTGEGNVIEEKGKEVIKETDKEDYKEKEKENGCDMTETKEEVEESKSEATETSSSEEAKEGSKPLQSACTESLPEISSFKSEDKKEIIEKEEAHLNDSSYLSVTEGTKEISLNESETGDKVQTESSVPSSEESGVKLNTKEATSDCANTEVQLEEQMNEGENKNQETLQAADKVKEDTDKLEEETNSERGGLATKSEASSKEAVEMEKSEIEPEEGEIAAKAEACSKETVQMNNAELEADISNETVQMEERAIVFEEEISREGDSAIKAEVTSKEDATIEPEMAISGEENSAREAEEASSNKVKTEPELAIFEGELATKPEASSKKSIQVDNKEIKPAEVISKEEDSDKKNEVSLKEDVEAEKFTVEPEMANSEAENPVTMVEVSSETVTEVKKEETEPEAAVFKEGDSATKVEVALKGDVEAEKAAIQPEVVVSQEVDRMISVEASSKAAISEEGDLAAKVEANSEAVIKAEKVETVTKETVSGGGDLITKFEASSDAAIEVEKADIEPEAAIPKEKDSATEFEAASEEDGAAQKSMTEPEEAISEVVESVTKVGGSTKEADELEKADIQPEGAISKESDSATEIKVASEEDVEAQKSTAESEVAISEEVNSVKKVERSTNEADEVRKSNICEDDSEVEDEASPKEAAKEEKADIYVEQDSDTKFEESPKEDVEVEKVVVEPEVAIHRAEDLDAKIENAYAEVETEATEPEAAISAERDLITAIETSKVAIEVEKEATKAEEAICEAGDSDTKLENRSIEAVEVEKAPVELEGRVPEVESSGTDIHKTPTDTDVESTEPGKKVDCNSDIVTRGHDNEKVSETTQSEFEDNRNDDLDHICESTEKKSLHEFRESRQDIQEKIEATADIADHVKETPKTDVTTEVATLTTEVHGDLDKTDDADQTHAKQLHTVDVQEERINEMKESSAEILNEMESHSNEIQKITETSLEEAQANDKQVQVPNVSSTGSSHSIEIEESQQEKGSSDSSSKLVADDVHQENVTEVKETRHENADIVEENKKDSETVLESKHEELYTAETEAEIEVTTEEMTRKQQETPENTDADVAKESKRDSGEIGEETKEFSKEMPKSQDDETITEKDISIVKTIPEEVAKEQCGTQENADANEIKEREVDHSIVHEFQHRELHTANIGEQTEEVSKEISTSHDDEAVLENEATVTETTSEGRSREMFETPENEDTDKVAESKTNDELQTAEIGQVEEISQEISKSQDKEIDLGNEAACVQVIPAETTKEHETPKAAVVEERNNESYIVQEAQPLEQHTAVAGEEIKEVSEGVPKSQQDRPVASYEVTAVETIRELDAPENAGEVAERKMDSDISDECQKHEVYPAESGEADEVTKSISKNQDEESITEKEVIILQANPEEEAKEQQETLSLRLPSREEECKTQAAIEEIEHKKREILSKVNEDPESSFEQKTTGEMSQEEPKELEDSKLEPELKTGEVYTEKEEQEKKEQSLDETKEDLKQNFEGTEPATEDKVANDQTVTETVSEVQNKSSPDELVLKEQEHETWTVIEKTEQNIDETEVLKHMAKETEESCFEKEECKKLEVTTKEAIETQVEAVQIINEEDSASIPKYDSRDSGEVKDNQSSSLSTEETKEPDEMAEISKEIRVDNPNENLTEKTAVSDKILDCRTETHEDAATFVSEFHSHRPTESEAETGKKILEAAATQLMTEENLSKKTIDETESTLNEVKKEQIDLEKDGAKDCQSISHGKETTKDKHVELELKAEDSNVDKSTEKEKKIEEVHKETEETDASKTMADNTEKRTVEQLHQAVTEDGSIKESIPDNNDCKVKQEGTEEIIVQERREDLGGKLSKEVATGITEENRTTRDTNQGEKTLNATPEKPIMKEAEPGKTTDVTTPTERSIGITGKIEAIEESTESAKISQFNMMQRSTREKQATAQENEPKDEVKAETSEKTKSDEEKYKDEEDEENRKNDSGSDAPVMVEATKDIDVKVSHKKSHNILSGVGSKVKHSISKVKKAITGKSSHSKQHSPKSGAKEQANSGN